MSAESRERLPALRAAGHVRVYRQGREDVVLPTVPAVFILELAEAAAAILEERGAADAKAAGGHLEHNLGDHGRVLWTEQGAIEATTQTVAEMLARPWERAEDFVAAVLEDGSLPLLHRLMIALRTVRGYRGDRAEWANEVLRDHLVPEIKRLLGAAPKPKQATRCLVPAFDGALFSQQWKDALWDRFFTGAPARQRRSVE